MLCNLKGAYVSFKVQNLEVAEFLPKAVLAGASGTCAVCMSTSHQNVKLKISGANLYD